MGAHLITMKHDIYYRQDPPEAINITFNSNPVYTYEIEHTNIAQIKYLIISNGTEFIQAITPVYQDKLPSVAKHQQVLQVQQFEHIEYVQCSYSHQGIHSITFKTTTGTQISSQNQSKGTYSRTVNLRPHNKAIIGMRCCYNGNHQLVDLYIYVAVRLDIITNRDPACAGRRNSISIPDTHNSADAIMRRQSFHQSRVRAESLQSRREQ